MIRPPEGASGWAWACLVWVPGAAWLFVNAFRELRGDVAVRVLALGVAGLAVALGSFLMLRAKRSWVFLGPRGIIVKPTLGKLRHASWSRVREVEYWPVRRHLAFRTSKNTVQVRVGLAGLSAFLDQARKALPKAMWSRPFSAAERDHLDAPP